MVLTTHALIGAAIGKKFMGPWSIIPVSLAAHFLMDSLHHGEYVENFDSREAARKVWWKIILDLSIGLFIILLSLKLSHAGPEKYPDIFLGIFFSLFPDLLTLIYWKYKIPALAKIYSFHARIHRHPRSSPKRAWNLRNALNDLWLSALGVVFLFI